MTSFNYIHPLDENIQVNIHNHNCLELLNKLPDNSIDCIITDPPYFIDKLDSKWDSSAIDNDTSNSHIKHLPKGMKFDKKQVKELYDFYLQVSQILFEKLKPGGFFLSFSSPRLYHSIAMACEIAGFEIRDMINWTYTQSMPKGMSVNHVIDNLKINSSEKTKIKEKYTNFKTPMIKACFEPICLAMKPISEKNYILNELNFNTGLIDFSHKVGIENNKVPANIITTELIDPVYDKNFMVSKPSKKEKGDYNSHITVKPVTLIEHLVNIFSKEGATILDPFIGSGTTAIACMANKRNCIGYEINNDYYNIACQRITEYNQ